jgi:hypothetical protein
MGILKNKQEQDNYISSILSSQGSTMDEKMLQLFLWEKIKILFNYDETVKEKFLDNDDNIVILEDTNGVMVIGYLHIGKQYDKNSKHDSNLIINSLGDFIRDINKLAISMKIKSFRFIILTTYRLSEYNSDIFSSLQNDISYFYLAEIGSDQKLHFDLNRDEKIIDLIANDILIDDLFSELTNENNFKIWNCDICGGNQDSGCQFFDPSECPKFN